MSRSRFNKTKAIPRNGSGSSRLYILLGVLLLLIGILCCSGCSNHPPKADTAKEEQARTEANQKKLLSAQPPVTLNWSLEREQINKRTDLWNEENKVSYIYLIDFGKVMAHHVIKGKVSSVNSQITNPQQIVENYRSGHSYEYSVIDSPAEDGSYGTNGDAIFFFTTDGGYVEWNGKYFLSDKPFKMTTPPQITRNVD